MRNRRLPGSGLAAIALSLGTLIGPGPATATQRPGAGASGPCGAFPAAHQLPGAAGVVPAAWSGGGLVVPACGPAPGDGTATARVYPYAPRAEAAAGATGNLQHAAWAWHHQGDGGW